MRSYPINSSKALARLIAMAVVADGRWARTEYPVLDFATAQASQTWRFPPFFHALLDAGVYPPCSAYEAWFVSAALDDAAFDTIAAALPAAARAAAAATDPETTDA